MNRWTSTALLLPLALLPATASVAADAAVEKVSVRAVARFDFDRAEMRDEDRQALLAEVMQMRDVTWQTVTATGHTDSQGSVAYNEQLAARRAQSVRNYLLGKGLDASMLRTRALGPKAPVADNGDAAGRAQNRRTEVQFEGVRAAQR